MKWTTLDMSRGEGTADAMLLAAAINLLRQEHVPPPEERTTNFHDNNILNGWDALATPGSWLNLTETFLRSGDDNSCRTAGMRSACKWRRSAWGRLLRGLH